MLSKLDTHSAKSQSALWKVHHLWRENSNSPFRTWKAHRSLSGSARAAFKPNEFSSGGKLPEGGNPSSLFWCKCRTMSVRSSCWTDTMHITTSMCVSPSASNSLPVPTCQTLIEHMDRVMCIDWNILLYCTQENILFMNSGWSLAFNNGIDLHIKW